MTPIFASEKPALRISMNCFLVTASSPISPAASSRTPAITRITWSYSAALSSLPSSAHASLYCIIFPGISQSSINCHRAAALSLSGAFPFFITSSKGRNFSINTPLTLSAARRSASSPFLVCLVNELLQAFLPRIPAASR